MKSTYSTCNNPTGYFFWDFQNNVQYGGELIFHVDLLDKHTDGLGQHGRVTLSGARKLNLTKTCSNTAHHTQLNAFSRSINWTAVAQVVSVPHWHTPMRSLSSTIAADQSKVYCQRQ